jgi:hypothetical protein
MVTYLGILPRPDQAAAVLANTTGYFLMEMEHYDRIALRTTSSYLQHRLDRARRLTRSSGFFIGFIC